MSFAGNVVVPPGATLDLTLLWLAEAAVSQDYTAFVHLADDQERIWAQVDRLPVQGTARTHEWQAGQAFVDRYRLVVDPQTPPGSYRLLVGMYDPVTGERLATAGQPEHLLNGDRVLLLQVQVRE